MLANRHCVMPAKGFYKWREEDGMKQPYFFARKDGRPLMFAGFCDYSMVKGDAVPSFAILTDEPNELVTPYHDRMPVVLDDSETWLDPEATLDHGAPLGPRRIPGGASEPRRQQARRKKHRGDRGRSKRNTRRRG